MLTLVRWVLLIPAVIGGFYCSMLLSFVFHRVITSWCPGGIVISGACSLPWVFPFVTAIAAGSGAVFMIIAGVLMAPTNRKAVGWSIYVVGLIYACYMFGRIHAYAPILVAALAGVILLWGLFRRENFLSKWGNRERS